MTDSCHSMSIYVLHEVQCLQLGFNCDLFFLVFIKGQVFIKGEVDLK